VTLRRTQPVQYSLFQQFLPDDNREDYSNTIDLYDAIPKFFSIDIQVCFWKSKRPV
jgi:hypothetical protein